MLLKLLSRSLWKYELLNNSSTQLFQGNDIPKYVKDSDKIVHNGGHGGIERTLHFASKSDPSSQGLLLYVVHLPLLPNSEHRQKKKKKKVGKNEKTN